MFHDKMSKTGILVLGVFQWAEKILKTILDCSLKAHLHLPFAHAILLYSVGNYFANRKQVSSSKTHCNTENASVNGMWQ